MFFIPNVRFQMNMEELAVQKKQFQEKLLGDRPRNRLISLIESKSPPSATGSESGSGSVSDPNSPLSSCWSLRYFMAPKEFRASSADRPSHVGSVVFQRTQVDPRTGRASLVQPPQEETIQTGLVVRSIGYQIIPVPGVPFDVERNHVPHQQGRVIAQQHQQQQEPLQQQDHQDLQDDHAMHGDVIPGLYVAGWLKRGPSGVIAATMYDAFQTAATLASDLESGFLEKPVDQPQAATREQVLAWLTQVQPTRPVTFDDWKKVEAEEIRRGHERNKPREKITQLDEIYRLMGISWDQSSKKKQ